MSFYRPLYSSSLFPRMSFAPMSTLFDDAFWGPSFSSLYWDEPEPATTASSNKQRRLQQDSASSSSSGKSGSGAAVATRSDSGKQVSSRQRPGLSMFSPLLSGAGMPEMAVDVTSTPQAYNVHASVPGIDKRDISVTIEDGNVLRIQAERRSYNDRRAPTAGAGADANTNQKQLDKEPSATQKQQDKERKEYKPADEPKAGNAAPSAEVQGAESTAMQTDNEAGEELQYHHVESYYGRVERRLQLPEDVDVNGLTAKHENGVLSITIPRLQDKRPQQRRIEVA